MEAKRKISVKLIALFLLVAACILAIPFMSKAADTTTYTLTDKLVDGKDYLIVSSNSSGSAYALKNEDSSVARSSVTVSKQLTIAVDKDTTDIVWRATTIDGGFELTNGTGESVRYLKRSSGSLAIASSGDSRPWTYSDDQLRVKGSSSTTYPIYYSTSDKKFKVGSDDEKVYIYEAGLASVPVTGVTVDSTLNLEAGATSTLSATVAPTTATNKKVTWSSNNKAVATVDESTGEVTAVAAGTATITATAEDDTNTVKGECTVTVTAFSGTDITPEKDGIKEADAVAGLPNDKVYSIRVTNAGSESTYYVHSTDESVATISPSSAKIAKNKSAIFTVTPVKNGQVDILISNYGSEKWDPWEARENYRKGSVSLTFGANVPVTGVTLSPTSLSIFDEETSQLTATVAPTTATNKKVTWSSNTESVATVDQTGVVTGVAAGNATITVTTADGGYQQTCAVTVTAFSGDTLTPVSDTPPTLKKSIASNEEFKVRIKNGSKNDQSYVFTAKNYDTSVVSVNPTTTATVAAGKTAIMTFKGLKKGTTTVTITNNNSDSERTATVEIDVDGGEDPPSPEDTFLAFSSDVHNTSSGSSSTATTLNSWIDTVTGKIKAKFEIMGFTGDLGPQSDSSSSYWDYAGTVMDKVESNVNITGAGTNKVKGFYVCGNHEYSPGSYTHDKNDTTKKYSDAGVVQEYDDYILYSLGARQNAEIYSDNDINALRDYLDACTATKPIFILAHFPLHCYNNKTGEDETVHSGKAAVGSAKIIQVLNDASSDGHTIVFLWGHNHSSTNSYYDKVTTDKINDTAIKFTYAAAGCMKSSTSPKIEGKGLVAGISGNTLSLKYYDSDGNVVGTGADITISRTIKPAVFHKITASTGKNGTISPSGDVQVRDGRDKTFTFTPDEGYVLDTVTVDGTAVSVTGNSYTIPSVTGDHTINATFRKLPDPTDEVDLTPSTSTATKSVTIKAGQTVKVNIKNGSSSSAYDFTATTNSDKVLVTPDSQNIESGKTATYYVYGIADGSATVTFSNNNSSSERKATLKVTVGEEPKVDYELTPQSEDDGRPSISPTIKKNESITVRINNGSDSSSYNFKAESDDTTIATVTPDTSSIAAGDYAIYTINGIKDGETTITFRNNNTEYGEEYERIAYVYLTVGEPVVPTGDHVYVAFTSDVHNGSSSSVSSTERFSTWISTMKNKLGQKIETIGITGDLGPASGSDVYWTKAQGTMDVVDKSDQYVEADGFYVCGNHEYNPGSYTHDKNTTTQKYVDAGTNVRYGDDYVLYSMGARQFNETYSDADIAALKTFLENYKDDAPIFILAHFPLHCYNGKSGESSDVHDGRAAVGSAKIIAALNEAAEDGLDIVFLWGHNHSSSNDHYDKVYTDKINDTAISFTYAAAGCMSDSEYGSSANVKGKGLVAGIYDEQMTLTYYTATGAVVSTKTIDLKRETPTTTKYTITATHGEHGDIDPSNTVEVKEGRDKTFTFKPDAGYEVDKVIVDQKEVAVTGNTYTFEDVKDDHTIRVTFKKAQVKTYSAADEAEADEKYILVSNGYALLNNNGTMEATPVQVKNGKVYINETDVANATWTFNEATAVEEISGDFEVVNNGYYFTRESDSSGEAQAATITKDKKVSEESGLPYYQWSWEDTQLKQIGGQDGSATFYAYYDTSGGKFYTASDSEEEIQLFVVDEPTTSVLYKTHIQNIGWEDEYKTDGASSGTSGQSKRLESIKIKLGDDLKADGDIEYKTHIQDIGWESEYKSNDEESGTSGQAKRLEAIMIRLTDDLAEDYDVYYCVHAQQFGWLGWAKNGEAAGTEGYAYRLEAIKIIVQPKGQAAPEPLSSEKAFKSKNRTNGSVRYTTHVQDYGWQHYYADGEMAGTSGESKRLEGIKIVLNQEIEGGIEYRTHIQDYGWQEYKSNNAMSGTSGEAKRLEAIQIKLSGQAAQEYDVYYCVHAQNIGWMGWAKNDEKAGTAGYAYRLEGIKIMLVKKGEEAPKPIGNVTEAYMEK